MANYVTKEQFDGGISTIRQDIRELVRYVGSISLGLANLTERVDSIDAKTDAIIQLLVTRKELHNLTRELRGHGIQIADHKVFE